MVELLSKNHDISILLLILVKIFILLRLILAYQLYCMNEFQLDLKVNK